MTDQCSWCAHPTHDHPCPVTRSDKQPCPCARGLRFTTHHITCTTGCTEPELCDGCPCHQEET